MSFKQNFLNLTRHSFIYTISTFVQRSIGLIMLPFYTNVQYIKTVTEFGDYSLIYVFIPFANALYLFGMDAALMRFFFSKQHKRPDVFKTAFLSILINVLFISALIFYFSADIALLILESEQYVFFIKLVLLILIFDTFCNIPYLILRAEEKSVTFTVAKIIRFALELGLNLFFIVYMEYGVKGILYANIIAALINLIILFPHQIKYFSGSFDKKILKEMLLFGLPMIPNSVAFLTVELIDKFIMLKILSKESVAIYNANHKFGSILLLLITAYRTAWQPFFLKIADQPDAKAIYSRILTYFVLFCSAIIIFVSFFIRDILTTELPGGFTLLGDAQYWQGIHIIPVILLAYLFYGFYVNFSVGVFIQKKSHWMFFFTGTAALVNIFANFLLMPLYGISGAAFSTLASYFVMALLIFIYNQKIYKVDYHYSKIIVILLLTILFLFIHYQFDLEPVSKIIFILSYPVVLFLLRVINIAELKSLKSIFKK